MSDAGQACEALLVRLRHCLQALAMPADVQLSLLPDFVCKAGELALDFDHWSACVLSNPECQMSDGQRARLLALNDALEQMSGEGKQSLWTDQALGSRAEWERVRERAKAALASFQWGVECPPSYKDEYVRGTKI